MTPEAPAAGGWGRPPHGPARAVVAAAGGVIDHQKASAGSSIRFFAPERAQRMW
jgi:hypothetical protein